MPIFRYFIFVGGALLALLFAADFVFPPAAPVAQVVAATGNIYDGLWYPIIIAVMTLVVGTLFVRESKDNDINA